MNPISKTETFALDEITFPQNLFELIIMFTCDNGDS